MALKIEGVSALILEKVNSITDYFEKEFGCKTTLNTKYPNSELCIAMDVTLPKEKELFMPLSVNIKLFSFDPQKKVMTLQYFPE